MTRLCDLVVERYTTERVPNPHPRGELPWRLYQTVRNAVVRTCRCHGPTGPLGEIPLDKDDLDLILDREEGDEDPIYWVVDDQYNDERYLYMEFEDPVGFSPKWLEDVTATLRRFRGWGIGVDSLAKGYLLIFTDRLLVNGPGFKRCRDAADVIEAARKQIRPTRAT
jgi:hypothetical protein